MLLTANTNVNGKSKSYASKQTVIGESALALKHLKSFNWGGFEGLRVLLSELNSTSMGKPRVTKSKLIIENISAYFEKTEYKCKMSLYEMGVAVKCCQSCNFLESHCLLVYSK